MVGVWIESFVYVVVLKIPQGLVPGPMVLFKDQTNKDKQTVLWGIQNLTNKFKVKNWNISGVTEKGLISSVWLNSSRRGKLFSVYRALQTSGYSSPWFLFQTNHSKQTQLKAASCLFYTAVHFPNIVLNSVDYSWPVSAGEILLQGWK